LTVPIVVTVDNFNEAQSDSSLQHFFEIVRGGINQRINNRTPTPIDSQNRDPDESRHPLQLGLIKHLEGATLSPCQMPRQTHMS